MGIHVTFSNPSIKHIENGQCTPDNVVKKVGAIASDCCHSSLLSRIGRIAKAVFKTVVAVALYWINPSLFAVSFLASVVWHKQADEAIEKIKKVWQSQPWTSALLFSFASFLSLPVTLGAGSLLMGAHLGSSLALGSERNKDSFSHEEPVFAPAPALLSGQHRSE